jgi:hypothetical protein
MQNLFTGPKPPARRFQAVQAMILAHGIVERDTHILIGKRVKGDHGFWHEA